jgi:hypothetical protein
MDKHVIKHKSKKAVLHTQLINTLIHDDGPKKIEIYYQIKTNQIIFYFYYLLQISTILKVDSKKSFFILTITTLKYFFTAYICVSSVAII